MDEIVLDADLRFLMTGLDMKDRGELFTALLDRVYEGDNDVVRGVFCYVMAIDEKKRDKKQRMRELSALGVAARLKKLTEATPKVNRRLNERKEAKESILNNKNTLNLFSYKAKADKPHFVPPSVDEVRLFIKENHLDVDAAQKVESAQNQSANAEDTAKAAAEAQKAEVEAAVEAKKAEVEAAVEAKKAEDEASVAEKKAAVEDTKNSINNLKNAFSK